MERQRCWPLLLILLSMGASGNDEGASVSTQRSTEDNMQVNETVFIDKFESPLQPVEDYIIGVFLLLVGTVSLVGNGLSVIVFKGGKTKENNTAELLLLNVAVVNLLLACASYPAVTVSAFAHRWLFGDLGCTVYGMVCYFLGLATILSLTALALVRYVKTCYPNIGHSIDQRKAWFIITAIYAYSFMWAVFPLLGWGGYGVEPFGISCTLEWHSFESSGRSHIICVSIFCVFLPTIAITVSHVAIVLQVRRAETMLVSKDVGKQTSRAERQLFRMSWAVSLGFLVAWLPYACFSLWSAYGDASAIPLWATPIPVMLAKSSIAYNPVIYVIMTKRYRTEFKEAALKLMCPGRPRGSTRRKRNTVANLELPTVATATTNIEVTKRILEAKEQDKIDEEQESSLVQTDDIN